MTASPARQAWSLSLQDVQMWRQDRCLFKDLNVSLSKPILHITGANGSGKTTLIKLLTFTAKPETGVITWHADGTDANPREATAQMAFAGHAEGLNADLSVAENLSWGLNLHKKIQLSDIAELLKRHQLSPLFDQTAGSLSAGQRRRVALLRGVLSDSAIWLWDEPYANLDRAGRAWVDQLMQAHVDAGGVVVLSSHHQPQIADQFVQVLDLGS